MKLAYWKQTLSAKAIALIYLLSLKVGTTPMKISVLPNVEHAKAHALSVVDQPLLAPNASKISTATTMNVLRQISAMQ